MSQRSHKRAARTKRQLMRLFIPQDVINIILGFAIHEPYDDTIVRRLCMVCKNWMTIIHEEIIPRNIRKLRNIRYKFPMYNYNMLRNCENMRLIGFEMHDIDFR